MVKPDSTRFETYKGKEANIMDDKAYKNVGEVFVENYEYVNKEGKTVKGFNLFTWIPRPYNASEVQKVYLKIDKVSQFKDFIRFHKLY